MAILTNAEVAARVRGAAARKRISNVDLAMLTHMSRMAMSRRMRGLVPFTPEELSTLSDAIGAPVGEFFGERAA